MKLSRRGLLKATGLSVATGLAYGLTARSQALAANASKNWKLEGTDEYTNICCYCAGGCGSVCSVRDGELVGLEGDPDNPVNFGGLCPKGAAMAQLRNVVDPKTREVIKNPARVTRPMVRRPGSDHWEEVSWEEIVPEIAQQVKKTRDETFCETSEDAKAFFEQHGIDYGEAERDDDGNPLTLNMCPGIGSLGGSQENSEEEYLILKIMRGLGIVAIDNQARVCHSSTVVGLAPTFGRGSMTTHWDDFKNTDFILHCGSNSCESHPLSSQWLHKAHDNGAKWIVVDPRYTRTAEQADIYCPIRSGTDIAFYGGMINYIIEHDRWQHEYVINYTNASYLLDPAFDFDPETGLWSGWDEQTKTYDTTSWHYQTESTSEWDTSEGGAYAWVNDEGVPAFTPPVLNVPKKDETLQDEHCVWQQFAKHYARYDEDTVSSICGMDKDLLDLVYDTYTQSGAVDKSGVILYALGQTQHSYGGQNIRCMGIVQLLLGNVGVPGGGVAALRGEPNVQGATDMAMLVDDLPGYLKWPRSISTASDNRTSLRHWLETQTYSDGYYTNKPKFMVSFLKEWFGENARVDNDYGYDWLPKVPRTPDVSIISTFELMAKGVMKGYFAWGMNPAHSAPNARNARNAMANLDWMVVADWRPTETALFWQNCDAAPADIQTTVYYLPAALIYEKPGIILNSGRWLNYRYQAVEPWDQAKPDYEMCDLLWLAIRGLYEEEGGANPDPILKMKWDYYVDGKIDPRPVAWCFNGYNVAGTDFEKGTVDLVPGYSALKADGSTACGIWIYSGCWSNNDDPLNPAAQPCGSRDLDDPSGLGLYPGFSYAWPNNRRILYNRASADLNGKPWTESKKLVEWHEDERRWERIDVPDFSWGTDDKPIPPNNKAFFMTWEQNARLVSYGMNDGPLPEHYEPFESPTTNALNGSQNNPRIRFADYASTRHTDAADAPYVASTYSVTELWQTGIQTDMCPALVEAMPTQFLELPEELADELGIRPGDKARVFNNRGSVVVDTVITKRFKPMTVNGKKTYHVGLTHHYGFANSNGVTFGDGDIVNDLTPNVGDPNSFIPEYKAFMVNIEKA
ncbi:molybdopterin-dependent oxidoreductase [bacterium]|nr:molybdopterin-dependent oxidoreductase [bacterium]